MNKSIVITTIFDPTEAVKRFASLPAYNLIVVGDEKTSKSWACDNVSYLSVDVQNRLGFSLSKVLPYNHYCRKMIGYLHAISENSHLIIDTDDDNIPKENWGFPQFDSAYDVIDDGQKYINIYSYFTSANIWPRGLPLEFILPTRNQLENYHAMKQSVKIGVWQGLADEDPDVDAVYRLTSNEPCYFKSKAPVFLKPGLLCPFNSQNTAFRKELFVLLYLPTYVTFRFTDILRGYIAQVIMQVYGYSLGFTEATVVQKRNPHNYLQDFVSEIPMYSSMDAIVNMIEPIVKQENDISQNLWDCYSLLQKNGIVKKEEMTTLRAWLEDLKVLGAYI